MWSVQPKLFGWFHIVGLLFVIVFGYLGVVVGRKFKAKDDEKKTKTILWIVEICFILLEGAKETYYAIENGGYRWDLFPMQICSIIFLVMPIALLCKNGIVKDSILGFIGFCSLAGAAFYFCNPTVALNSKYIILSMHSYVWHWLMIATGTFIIVSFDLLKKDTLRMLLGSYTVWFIFAILAAIINNVCYKLAPELNIDYYHIGYVKVVYPVLNLIFKYPEPYTLFFITFIVYFALGTVGVYYIAKGVRDLNHKIFKKNEENIANEM